MWPNCERLARPPDPDESSGSLCMYSAVLGGCFAPGPELHLYPQKQRPRSSGTPMPTPMPIPMPLLPEAAPLASVSTAGGRDSGASGEGDDGVGGGASVAWIVILSVTAIRTFTPREEESVFTSDDSHETALFAWSRVAKAMEMPRSVLPAATVIWMFASLMPSSDARCDLRAAFSLSVKSDGSPATVNLLIRE